MSNLPINNSVSMNPNYLPQAQAQEKPIVDKARDPLLAQAFANTLIIDKGDGSKDGKVVVSREALNQLFDMIESVFRALRRYWTGQGALPQPMPDAGALSKSTPAASPASTLASDPAAKKLPEADGQLKGAPKAEVKAQLRKDIVSSLPTDAGKQPKASLAGKPGATLPETATPEKAATTAPVLPKVATETKPDLKRPAEIKSTVLSPAGALPKVLPGAKPQSADVPRNDLTLRPEDARATKTSPRDVPGITQDAGRRNEQKSDINMTVQVINCGLHHPEVNVTRHKHTADGQPTLVVSTPDKPKTDGQPSLVVSTPDKAKTDGQPTLVVSTPDKSKTDGQPSLVVRTPDKAKTDGQPALVVSTPDKPKTDGQPSLVVSTPDKAKTDGQPSLVVSTPDKPKTDGQPTLVVSTPDKSKAGSQPAIVPNTPDTPKPESKTPLASRSPVTPEVDTTPATPQPDVTPGTRPKRDLTSPGPADDSSNDVFNSRNRNRFDTFERSSRGRRTPA